MRGGAPGRDAERRVEHDRGPARVRRGSRASAPDVDPDAFALPQAPTISDPDTHAAAPKPPT
jgi:hypothetical protein